jgi:hypothetical protein
MDPDPGGPKTHGSGSTTLLETLSEVTHLAWHCGQMYPATEIFCASGVSAWQRHMPRPPPPSSPSPRPAWLGNPMRIRLAWHRKNIKILFFKGTQFRDWP